MLYQAILQERLGPITPSLLVKNIEIVGHIIYLIAYLR